MNNEEIRCLGEVQRLPLQKGDVIVITTPREVSEKDRTWIVETLSPAFPDNKVVVLTDGMKIGAMGQE